MSAESLIRTIGTALGQAQDHDLLVGIRVDGEWHAGHVQSKDGEGVVILTDSGCLMVIRLSEIVAVRLGPNALSHLALNAA